MAILASIGIFALAVLGLALGVLLSGRPLRGSCGGLADEGCRRRRLSCLACTRGRDDSEPG
jgi:hypothetical protein